MIIYLFLSDVVHQAENSIMEAWYIKNSKGYAVITEKNDSNLTDEKDNSVTEKLFQENEDLTKKPSHDNEDLTVALKNVNAEKVCSCVQLFVYIINIRSHDLLLNLYVTTF